MTEPNLPHIHPHTEPAAENPADIARHRALIGLLKQQIHTDGPLSLAQFMATCLHHPSYGYYANQQAVGAAGDFITAPEISQMFGELLGLWVIQTWHDMGQPHTINLVELGPGLGTLMADIIRTGRIAPAFLAAICIHLVDVNETLRARQAETLAPLLKDTANPAPTWHTDLSAIPDGPVICIANEYFDCLPIHQFERTQTGWCERCITLNPSTKNLMFALSPQPVPAAGAHSALPADADLGTICELSPSAISQTSDLAERLVRHGGRALIIDYGDCDITVPTFQALKRHAFHNPLENLGSTDLTAHVNFRHLAAAAQAEHAATWGPATQADLLNNLGLNLRAQTLTNSANAAQTDQIRAAVNRLTARDQMGELFKALCLQSPGLPPPPGFEPLQGDTAE